MILVCHFFHDHHKQSRYFCRLAYCLGSRLRGDLFCSMQIRDFVRWSRYSGELLIIRTVLFCWLYTSINYACWDGQLPAFFPQSTSSSCNLCFLARIYIDFTSSTQGLFCLFFDNMFCRWVFLPSWLDSGSLLTHLHINIGKVFVGKHLPSDPMVTKFCDDQLRRSLPDFSYQYLSWCFGAFSFLP